MHKQKSIKDKLIVALDVDSFEKAKDFVDKLYPTVKIFKVGSVLFTRCGPSIIEHINNKGARVFLDLKFHDIPHTVQESIESGMALKVFMMTVHAQGTKEMLESAAKAAKKNVAELGSQEPFIVGVTVLTSESHDNTRQVVLERAQKAKEAGLDGVVCSAQEAPSIRKEFGNDFIIVTPGIRPKNYRSDDQKRTATAREAINAGVDYIVVGRPITEDPNPKEAALKILKEIK